MQGCELSGLANKPMRSRWRWAPAALGVAIAAAGATGASALPLTPFRYRDQAQQHCPTDTVVWLDFGKGRYYLRSQKLYGRGFEGSYVCLGEARQSGYRRAVLGFR
jgi:hypothetical protein